MLSGTNLCSWQGLVNPQCLLTNLWEEGVIQGEEKRKV